MTRPNYSLKRFQQVNIGMLKREYGGCVTVYELVSATTNLETGVKAATYTSYVIPRAVVLPVHAVRALVQTISVISANKKLVQGGTFDVGDRVFIIDRKDVPATFELEKDDWIEYGGDRYDLKYVDSYEPGTSWMAVGRRIEGVTPELHLRAYPRSDLELSDEATAIVE